MRPHPLLEVREGDELLRVYYDNNTLMGLDVIRPPDYNKVLLIRTRNQLNTECFGNRPDMKLLAVMYTSSLMRDVYDRNVEKYAYKPQMV